MEFEILEIQKKKKKHSHKYLLSTENHKKRRSKRHPSTKIVHRQFQISE